MRSFISLLAAATLLAPASAQILDNEGTEFLCAFNPNAVAQGITSTLEVHLTSDTPTTVSIRYPSTSPTFMADEAVTPGAITIVELPVAAGNAWVNDQVSANLVGLSAAEEFTAYLINRSMFTSDAALALPVDTMNTEYILADYSIDNFSVDQGHFAVYARFDDTTVTITPATELIGGRAAGVPFTVTLDAGEGYFGKVANAGVTQSLTGSIVTADRVIGVSSGNPCSAVPSGVPACDHIFAVIPPTQTWGTEALLTNLPNRPEGTVYRIIGSVDGTQIELDGVPLGTVNRGSFFETAPLPADGLLASTGGEPFLVVQYMTGIGASSIAIGDPSMGNVIPPAQFKESYTFSTVGGSQFAEHWVTISARNSDVGTLSLNGIPVDAAEFSPIGTSDFSVARIMIPEGTYATSSTMPHGITVQGFNQSDSYLYPGGARFQFINPVGDANPPTCDVDPITGVNEATVTVRDDRPSEDTNGNLVLDAGEDLNGNGLIDEDTGIFFVALAPGSTNLALDPPAFQPGDATVDVTVRTIDAGMDASGGIVVTDGAGNETTCAVDLSGNLGQPVCVPVPNSTGDAASTRMLGQGSVAANDLTLTTDGLPAGVMCLYVNSRQAATVIGPGGSSGNLCIASFEMGRHTDTMLQSDASGRVSLGLDLTAIPFEPGFRVSAQAGETWYWQLWYRDVTTGGAQTSNFCNAVRMVMQ